MTRQYINHDRGNTCSFTDGAKATRSLERAIEEILAEPLHERLAATPDREAEDLRELCQNQEPVIETARDLLRHPEPPIGLLILLKRAAKTCRESAPEQPCARTAKALYYAAIGIAWVRRHTIITTVDIKALRTRLAWAADQPWSDSEIRNLLRKAAEKAALVPPREY